MQKNEDVDNKHAKIYCTNNQFPELEFCGPHNKPHGARGLIKYYHMHFDTKLGHGTCEMNLISCSCT